MDRRLMLQFWGACGAIGPLTVRAGGGPGEGEVRRDLPVPFAVIGRHPKADVVLDDEEVSRRHAYVQVIAGRILWVDLGSREGVAGEGTVGPSGWLGDGEAIEIGPFRVEAGPAAAGEGAAPGVWRNPLTDRCPAGWPDAALEFPNHPGGPARRRLGRVLTLIGRSADCRLRIADDDVSRYHCALLRTPDGPWAVDLLSREGIRVDGTRVRWARLEPGASLHVGRYRMIIRPVEPDSAGGDDGRPPGLSVPPLPREQLPEVAPRRRPPAPVVERPSVEVPAVVERAGELDAYIGRLEQMQRQMFDQFHQMMLAMFQAFGSMQRDQMAQVQQELDRIRELGQELQAIRTGDAPSPGPAPDPAPVPASEGRPRPSGPPPRPEPWVPRDRSDREVHDLICRRIAEIEGERQGRWKRVLDLVTGNAGP